MQNFIAVRSAVRRPFQQKLMEGLHLPKRASVKPKDIKIKQTMRVQNKTMKFQIKTIAIKSKGCRLGEKRDGCVW